jgi:hypothetical protein
LEKLSFFECREVREEVLELPHVQPTVDMLVRYSHVKEVVLAGGVRMACKDREGSSMDSDLDKRGRSWGSMGSLTWTWASACPLWWCVVGGWVAN